MKIALRMLADWLADLIATWLAPKMAEKLAARDGGPGEERQP